MIRDVEVRDFEKWYNLRQKCIPDLDQESHYMEMNEISNDKHVNCALIQEFDNEVIGFVELSILDYSPGCHTSPVCRIDSWYVDEQFRKKGIGKGLIEAGEKWAKRNNCLEIGSVVDIKNTDSIRIHKRLGYYETSIDDIGINFIKEIEIDEKYFGLYELAQNYSIRQRLGIIILNDNNQVAVYNKNGIYNLPNLVMKEREYYENSIRNYILYNTGYASTVEKFICKASEYFYSDTKNAYVKDQGYFYRVILKDKVLDSVNKELVWIGSKYAINNLVMANDAWALTEEFGDIVYIF